jgi:hypothetical protein
MGVVAVIKSGMLWAEIIAIVADVNPVTFLSQIYRTGRGSRFAGIPTTYRLMEAHVNV